MSDIPPQLWNAEELELETDTEDGTKIQLLERQNAKEIRLGVLRTLLKKRRERERSMKQIEKSESPSAKNGPDLTASGNVKPDASGMLEENLDCHPSTGENQTDRKNSASNTLNTEEPRSGLPALNSKNTLPTSEIIESQSMNLLDESANHMFDLMKGLHANQPPAQIRAFDPERVNSAVACANTIYKIMRLKLDAIKVQRKLK